jgi:hypothetical protein
MLTDNATVMACISTPIDYATPADRLGTSLDAKRAAAWAYLNERGISVLRHGFVPTSAVNTDVQATIVRAMRERINQDCARFAMGVPSLLRRQAA